jgi:hypothetical protein
MRIILYTEAYHTKILDSRLTFICFVNVNFTTLNCSRVPPVVCIPPVSGGFTTRPTRPRPAAQSPKYMHILKNVQYFQLTL